MGRRRSFSWRGALFWTSWERFRRHWRKCFSCETLPTTNLCIFIGRLSLPCFSGNGTDIREWGSVLCWERETGKGKEAKPLRIYIYIKREILVTYYVVLHFVWFWFWLSPFCTCRNSGFRCLATFLFVSQLELTAQTLT